MGRGLGVLQAFSLCSKDFEGDFYAGKSSMEWLFNVIQAGDESNQNLGGKKGITMETVIYSVD